VDPHLCGLLLKLGPRSPRREPFRTTERPAGYPEPGRDRADKDVEGDADRSDEREQRRRVALQQCAPKVAEDIGLRCDVQTADRLLEHVVAHESRVREELHQRVEHELAKEHCDQGAEDDMQSRGRPGNRRSEVLKRVQVPLSGRCSLSSRDP
jgi:hypothetical protein